MLKRTLYFSKPFYLSTRDEQLVISPKDAPEAETRTAPIEDIGFLLLEHPQITISHTAIQRLAANNTAVIWCDEKHLPASMLLPLQSHHLQNERFRRQVEASEPLKKQLWKQTITAKLENQAHLLQKAGKNAAPLHRWKLEVQSGDPSNKEAQGSRYYWEKLFQPHIEDFLRDRFGEPPNNLLNYGYAILRAAAARSLVGAGLLPTLGIHHHNRYNAYCLADDLMEPYRPFVDDLVLDFVRKGEHQFGEIAKSQKVRILELLTADTMVEEETSPLMIALNRSAASMAQCFSGERRQLVFPKLPG